MPTGGVAAPEDAYHPKAGVYVANSSWGEFAGYSASIVANKSIAWLREVAGKGKPFMLTVSRTKLGFRCSDSLVVFAGSVPLMASELERCLLKTISDF